MSGYKKRKDHPNRARLKAQSMVRKVMIDRSLAIKSSWRAEGMISTAFLFESWLWLHCFVVNLRDQQWPIA